MPFNLKQQLAIQSGELKPTGIDEPMIDYIHAASINFARVFQSTHKVFNEEDHSLAAAYLNKMLSATARAITGDSSSKNAALVIMVSFIAGHPTIVEQGFVNATQEEYESFINSYIEQSIELTANVKVDEKAAYGGI